MDLSGSVVVSSYPAVELIDKAIGSEFSSCFSCFIPLAKERLSEVGNWAWREIGERGS